MNQQGVGIGQRQEGPGNRNSATSSVASCLEAPHGSGDQNSLGKEDVGYHLLSVCKSLSNGMSTFMGRRSMALDLRRRERGALLTALQDVVSVSQIPVCLVLLFFI